MLLRDEVGRVSLIYVGGLIRQAGMFSTEEGTIENLRRKLDALVRQIQDLKNDYGSRRYLSNAPYGLTGICCA